MELGFAALSRESGATPLDLPDLVELPVSLDWFSHRKRVRLSRPELAQRLAAEIGACERPVGIMFHHALMDDGELRDAAALLHLLAEHDSARGLPMAALIGVAAAGQRVTA